MSPQHTNPAALRLPRESHAPRHRARPFAVAAWVAVWLALLNVAGMGWLDRAQGNPGYVVVRTKWSLVRDLREPVDYLIVGDSSCNQGIDPHRLGERLGGTALNLCTVGDMTTIGDAWLTQAYVDRHGPPSAVVVGHAYDVWHRDDAALKLALWNIEGEGWPLRGFEPALELTLRETVSNAIAPYAPLYTQPKALLRSLTGGSRPRVHLDSLGFLSVQDADPERVEDDTNDHLDRLASSAPSLSDANARGLDALVKLAATHRVPVIVVHGPVYEGLGQAPLYRERIAELNALLGPHLASNPLVRLGMPEPMQFPAEQMQNADHVTRAGAERYTDAVANAVVDVMEGEAPSR